MGVWGGLEADKPLDETEVERRVVEISSALTLDEKIWMLSGDLKLRGLLVMAVRYNKDVYVGGEVERLGIPGVRFTDGPRGVAIGRSTAFPVPMARGASFDPDLEERVSDAIAVEARSQGANLYGGICINLLRHPSWGRAQETYGEDPHLLAEMGVAAVRGAQRHMMACIKHFACNSMENARFKVDVRIDDADLADIYLPHFKACVDAGAASVMSAYNKVDGEWCGHSHKLLTETLKENWGFDGFVVSDWVFGVRDGAAAVNGGQDLEMPFRWRLRKLPARVADATVPHERIDDAVARLLRMQLRFCGVGEPERYGPHAVVCDAHRALARETAQRSIVLLRNVVPRGDAQPALPLERRSVRTLAVVGQLAAAENTGDHGSSRVRSPGVVTVLEGLRSAAARHGVSLREDPTDDATVAAAMAASADAAVVVVGCSHRDEGEYMFAAGGDRVDLRLNPGHERLVEAVAAVCPRTVVVLMGGSAFITESWREQVAAMVMAWYPGVEGGNALADVLFGDAEPGGRLPCTWPRSQSQLPPFDPDARQISYGPLHGYRLMEAEGREPAFWFGHGLTYTSIEYGATSARMNADGGIDVDVELSNKGGRHGDEVVQVYLDQALGTESRRLPALRAFRRVSVEPGETVTVRLGVGAAQVERAVSEGIVTLRVGPSADPATHTVVKVELGRG